MEEHRIRAQILFHLCAVMSAFWQFGPIPVWPYFFLALVTAVLGAVFVVISWPPDYPGESGLTKVSGDIEKVVVRNNISKTSAGTILPAMSTVYFKLKGYDDEFRYPSNHPKYPLVRDYTAVAIDVWVTQSELGSGAPVTIWKLQERNPRDKAAELTNVSYDEIIERLTTADRSMRKIGYWSLVACGGFLLLGLGVRRWNRDRPHRLA